MSRIATNWTGAVVVNGLMAIVLLAWLATGPTRSPVPQQPATTSEPDQERPRDVPIETPASIDLPPPPSALASRHDGDTSGVINRVSPMRPSIDRERERPIEIVPLRAAEIKPRPATAPIPTPLRPVEERAAVSNPVIAQTPDREGSGRAESNDSSMGVDAEAVGTGRALLRILEHGEGPGIEIAWPGTIAQRERLYDVLRRCFGMKLALIDRAGGLYLDDGPKGRTWPINLDRFSGFVRRPNGGITSDERRAAGRVARYHRRLPATDLVRLFPRATDAALLGGLAHLLGDVYRESKSITASYRLRGGRVTIGDIRVDGRRVSGEIDLSRGASRACRGTGRT